MSGNLTIFILIFILFYNININNAKRAELKGGLLFERDTDQPVLINPKYALYHREVNLDHLLIAADHAIKFAEIYHEFCDKVDQTIANASTITVSDLMQNYHLITTPTRLKDAPQMCDQIGYILPEVRTFSDLKSIRQFATQAGVTQVYAGVTFNTYDRTFKYRSTATDITYTFDKIKYIPDNQENSVINNLQEPLAIKYATRFPEAVYDLADKARPLVLLQPEVAHNITYIICQKQANNPQQKLQNTYTLSITSHICNRDRVPIEQQAKAIKQEVTLFRHLTDEPIHENEKLFPTSKQARGVDPRFTHSNYTIAYNTAEPCREINCKSCKSILMLVHKKAFQYSQLISIPSQLTLKYLQYELLSQEQTNITFWHFVLAQNWQTLYNPANRFFESMTHINCHLTNYTFTQEFLSQFDLTPLQEMDHTDFIYDIDTLRTRNVFYDRDYKPYSIYGKSPVPRPSINDRIDFTTHNNNTDNQTLSRQKRFLALALLDALPSYHKLWTIFRITLANSRQIATLGVAADALKEGYNQLYNEILTLRNVTEMQENALHAMFAEKDTKDACNKLQQTIQNALLKLSNALTEALNNRASPYILSSSELQAIALRERTHKLLLSTNIQDVHTTLYRNDTSYIFAFAIPVIDDKSSYRLYTTRSIPLFTTDGDIYTLDTDITYLGISADTTRYVDLTQQEYTACHQQSFCQITGFPNSFNNKPSCTALSYRTNTVQCDKTKLKDAHPFFATYETATLYSVPQNFSLDIICPNQNSKQTHDPIRGYTQLSGIGEITINPNCFLKLPDDRIIEGQYTPGTSTPLGISNILDALHYLPKAPNYSFNWTKNEFWTDWVPPAQIEHPDVLRTVMEFFENVFDPSEFSAHSTRTIIIIVILFILFGLFCFFSKDCFRWAKTFFLISNPKKYWTKHKGYYVPYFDKIPKAQSIIQRGKGFQFNHSRLGQLFNKNKHTDEHTDKNIELNAYLNSPVQTILNKQNNTSDQTDSLLYPHIGPLRNTQSNTYTPADNPDTDINTDTPQDDTDWRLETHRAALRLKALNAHKHCPQQ